MEMIRAVWEFIRDTKNSNAIIAIFTILIFLTGLAYAVFAALQWTAMRKATTATQQQIEDSKAVQAARLTLEVSPIITEIAGQSALVDWQPLITNAGNTIAVEINVSVVTYDIRGADGAYAEPKPVPKPVPNPSPTGDSLLPGKSRQYPFKVQIVDWDKALSRESTVISLWQVSYRDIFNRPQVAPYCFYYDARSKTFSRCPPFTQPQ